MAANPSGIKSYMPWAILTTIFCCWPFGIPAIVFACKTNAALNQGNLELAAVNSKKAKTWTLVTLITGLVLQVIGILFQVLVVSQASSRSYYY